jgi:hypothetical protein
MSAPTRALLLATLCAFGALACGAGRPRLRLHGWPDDVDLVEILEVMVDDPTMAVRYAPALQWTKGGQTTHVEDPSQALQSFRALIKEAASPPRDATPRALRCDAALLRCLAETKTERTTFSFTRGAKEARYLLLQRMETQPR